jgi:hypothetical protein
MNSNFHFSDPNNLYIHSIHPKWKVCIKRISHSVALLYFRDNCNDKVPIPPEIQVYTFDYNKKQPKVILQPSIINDYTLCWTDNYTVEWNGEIVLNIKNKRSWKITSNELLNTL